MNGDCRGGVTGEQLQRLAGVTGDTWFLSNAAGVHVDASITADSGGSMCTNGVGFNLQPRMPLPPGDYELVLLLDAVHWPYVADDPAITSGGHRELRRRYRVLAAQR